MEEALGNDEEKVLLAISRLGDQAFGDAILGAVRGDFANEAAEPIGAALRMLEDQGIISRVAKDAALSDGDVRYLVTAEGNRILADKEGDLANLTILLDRRIARYYRLLRSNRNSEHKRIFWSGIGPHGWRFWSSCRTLWLWPWRW